MNVRELIESLQEIQDHRLHVFFENSDPVLFVGEFTDKGGKDYVEVFG